MGEMEPTNELQRKPPILVEAGDTGLKHHSGRIEEEWHADLRGSLGVQVYREVYDNDPIVGPAFMLIRLIAEKVKLWVDPTGSTLQHAAAAKLCETALDDVAGGTKGLMNNALSLLPFGWSWLEKVFKICRGDSTDPMMRSKYNDGAIRWRKLAIRAQETLHRWDFNDAGEVDGMWQRAAPQYKLTYIPRAKSLHFRVVHDKNNPEGRSFLRNVYTSYHFKKNLQFTEAVGIFRNVAGYPVMEVPAEMLQSNTSSGQSTAKTGWEDFVKKVSADELTGAVIPSELDSEGKPTGYRFRLIASSGRNMAETDPIIKRYANWTAIALMAQFIMLGMDKVGSFALADSHTDMFAHGIGACVDAVIDQMNNDAFPELVALNGFDKSVTPELKRGDIESPDLAKIGGFIQQTISSGAIIPDAKLDEHLRDVASLPRAEPETARPAAGAVPPPGDLGFGFGGDAMATDDLGMPMGETVDMVDAKVIDTTPTSGPINFLTPQQVADRWGFSSGTVRKFIVNGMLPARRFGSRFRIAQHDIEAFEEESIHGGPDSGDDATGEA